MKPIKITPLLPAAIISAAVAMSLVSCGSKDNTNRITDGIFATDSISYSDSIKVDGTDATCDISVDYPTGNASPLDSSVRKWINSQLSATASEKFSQIKSTSLDTIYDGSTLLKTLTSYIIDGSRKDLTECNTSAGYEFDWKISKSYETDRYVTYTFSAYTFLGGAHGSFISKGSTFSKPEGIQFGWDIFKPDSIPAIRNMVKQAIMHNYFNASTPVSFQECLLINPADFPLPTTPPLFLDDGMHFIYQQYEIAPYAAGLPECTIPYTEIQNMMTSQARALTGI